MSQTTSGERKNAASPAESLKPVTSSVFAPARTSARGMSKKAGVSTSCTDRAPAAGTETNCVPFRRAVKPSA